MEVVGLIVALFAAGAGAVAAWKAWQTVSLTDAMRRDERRDRLRQQVRELADALLRVQLTADRHPQRNVTPVTQHWTPYEDALDNLRLALTLFEVDGISDAVADPIMEAVNKRDVWKRPMFAMLKASEAHRALYREADKLIGDLDAPPPRVTWPERLLDATSYPGED